MNIPSHITAAIFDMDGLMIDSEPFWAKADKEFFKRHNKPYAPEINLHIMGMGQREIIENYKKEFGFIGETQNLIVERKNILYEFLLVDITLMEGVREIIVALQRKGLKLAIATSGHTSEKAGEILGKVGLKNYFSIIVSGDDVSRSKPAPDIYLKTAEQLQTSPSECIVFEDAPNGVQAGKTAGMTVYGINNDEEIFNKLKETGADEVFKSLAEITI